MASKSKKISAAKTAGKNAAAKAAPKANGEHAAVGAEWPTLAVLMAALILTLAVMSHNPADPSFQHGGQTPPQNYLGLVGAYASSFLVACFGLWAFWPVAALLIYAWMRLKRIRVGDYLMSLAGAGLLAFSSLALFSIIWPKLESVFPGYSGGGFLGEFLANSAVGLLGRPGSFIILPVLCLGGLTMISGKPLAVLARLGAALKSAAPRPEAPVAPRQEKRLLGLELDPRAEASAPEAAPSAKEAQPVIIARNSAPEKPERSEKKPAPELEVRQGEYRGGPYALPSLDFLDPILRPASQLSDEELTANARLLEEKLRDFGVDGRVLEVAGGPVITMYEYQPAPGIKIAKIAGLADDLTMAMRAIAIRVVAPIPGKAAIGLELPNPERGTVGLREVMESPFFQNARSPLSLVLGVDIMGNPVVTDLAKMPHLLIAGATGSGKSVGLNAMIMSILYKAGPETVRFLMIDPKCVELALYKDIPHLIYPVLSDPTEATLGLKWAVAEMELRYKLLAEKGVRNIEGYNDKIRAELKTWKKKDDEEPPKTLPLLVIIIDELADLMTVAAKEVEVHIMRLAQKARAAGIHLILATQRPSVDVLTGIIKANLPTRISFQVFSKVDSRTILDQIGAEKLLGRGDMLFIPPGVGKLKRLHGAFVTDDEIKRVADFVRAWGPPDYLEDLNTPDPDADPEASGEKDEKYDDAVALVRRTQKASISHIQRHLRIGYNRAARIIEDMEREGVIGPADGVRPRVIL